MRKVALLAAAVAVATSTAMATNTDLEPGAAPTGDVPCHAVQPLDLSCTVGVVDTSGDSTISAAELASFAAPPVADWAPLHPPHGTALDFKDAATEPAAILPTTLDREGSRRLIPALLALGALVVLLRRRPT
jgi:hypothetical protein